MAAHRLLPEYWPHWSWQRPDQDPTSSTVDLQLSPDYAFGSLEPCAQLDDRQRKALREELGRADAALRVARKVATMPRGRYPKSTMHPGAYLIGYLLAYDVVRRAQEKDVDGALTSCRALLSCGRSIGDDPDLMRLTARVDLNRMAAKMAERTLAQGEPSDETLLTIQRDFQEEGKQPLFLIAARYERARIDQWMEGVQNGVIKLSPPVSRPYDLTERPRFRVMLANIRATCLKRNNRYVEIAKLPTEEQIGPVVELSHEPDVIKQSFPILVATQFNPQTVMLSFHPNCAEVRCAAAMVAVERYRLQNKRWPDSLASLVPMFMPRVPLDPYTGKLLRYRRLDDGVVIYSLGRDCQDNGGNLGPATEIAVDLGFRLWDTSHRRKPAKPSEGNRNTGLAAEPVHSPVQR